MHFANGKLDNLNKDTKKLTIFLQWMIKHAKFKSFWWKPMVLEVSKRIKETFITKLLSFHELPYLLKKWIIFREQFEQKCYIFIQFCVPGSVWVAGGPRRAKRATSSRHSAWDHVTRVPRHVKLGYVSKFARLVDISGLYERPRIRCPGFRASDSRARRHLLSSREKVNI